MKNVNSQQAATAGMPKRAATPWKRFIAAAALILGCGSMMHTLAHAQIVQVQRQSAHGADTVPRVVTSIKPVHSLVASIMQGAGQPTVLLAGNDSPHTFSMRPAQARELNQAELIFWVGPGLETFMEKPLLSLGRDAEVVALAQAPSLQLLDYRDQTAFGVHDHEQGDSHEEHAHTKHGAKDMHVWLDPQNARLMAKEIAERLSAKDPTHAALYAQNLQALDAQLVALDAELSAQLAPIHAQPFIVFHDAYHYMERHFKLNVVGAITISPDAMPGAAGISKLREQLRTSGARCVFSEPQFEPKIIQTLVEGTTVKTGVLNPEGGEMAAGPNMYAELMRTNVHALQTCLSGATP